MQSIKLVIAILLSLLPLSNGFANRAARKVITRDELPTLNSDIPLSPPKGVSTSQFYPPTYTLLRAGPVSFVRRITDPKKYNQVVFKYMQDFKENSLMTAQGNADAFLAQPGM